MIKYSIKHKIVTNPEIDLPKNSQVISIKHHDKYILGDVEYPECWQIVWLEPLN